MARKRLTERQKLVNKLDRTVSRLVRLLYARSDGMLECWTCGETKHWKQVDAGHYISRRHKSVRWDLRNIRPQCKICNGFGKGFGREKLPGEAQKFAEKLEAQGVDVGELEALGRQAKTWTVAELRILLTGLELELHGQEVRHGVR